MIEELGKLVAQHNKLHSLAQPIVLNEHGIIIPTVQLSRFPILRFIIIFFLNFLIKIYFFSNFNICSLPPHLAPNVVEPDDLVKKIFIYSPFQNRKKDKQGLFNFLFF